LPVFRSSTTTLSVMPFRAAAWTAAETALRTLAADAEGAAVMVSTKLGSVLVVRLVGVLEAGVGVRDVVLDVLVRDVLDLVEVVVLPDRVVVGAADELVLLTVGEVVPVEVGDSLAEKTAAPV